MSLARRVARAGAVLDRVPRAVAGSDPLPQELVPFALELRDAHEAVEHARRHAPFAELHGGLWDRLCEDAFFAAHRFAIEVRRLDGEEVSCRERQLEQWQEQRDAAMPHAERVAAATVVEPEPEAPEAPQLREVRLMLDNRTSMVEALGRPSRHHRELAEELRTRFGRTL